VQLKTIRAVRWRDDFNEFYNKMDPKEAEAVLRSGGWLALPPRPTEGTLGWMLQRRPGMFLATSWDFLW